MNVLRRTPVRQLLIVTASLSILIALAAAAVGQVGPNVDPSKPIVVGNVSGAAGGITATVGPGMVASGSGAYPLCCPNGSIQGITATGQSEVHGSGPAARDAALARGVSDATDQAQAVADAAGITLGAPGRSADLLAPLCSIRWRARAHPEDPWRSVRRWPFPIRAS
jgi:hypothetical protein